MPEPSRPPVVRPGTKLEPGKLYARLYHGRKDQAREMDGWGFTGPVFGPLACATLTYLQHLRLLDTFRDGEAELWAHADTLVWEGCYYGDVELFVAAEGETA